MPAHAARRSEAMGISQYTVPVGVNVIGTLNRKLPGRVDWVAYRRLQGTQGREPHEVLRTRYNVLSL